MRNGGGVRPLNSVVRHHVIAGHLKCSLYVAALFAAIHAQAVCIEQRPTPQAEFDASPIVVLGQVVSEQRIPESSKFEFGGIRYVVAVDEVLKGAARKQITLVNQNDSGRFPMDKGKRYLLFVTAHRHGFVIWSCGNSGETNRVADVLDQVRKHKESKGT